MPLSDIVIKFTAEGTPNVGRALRGVVDAAAGAERAQTRAAQQEAIKRQRIVDQEAKAKLRTARLAETEIRRGQDKAARDAEQAGKAKVRAADTAAREQVRIWQRADAEERRIRNARFGEEQRQDRQQIQVKERLEAERHRKAAQWVRQQDKMAWRQEVEKVHDRRRMIGALGGAASLGVQMGSQRVGHLAQQTAGMVTQLGGGFSIADSLQRNVSLKGKLADVASRGVVAGDAANAQRRSTSSLESSVRGVTTEFGLEAEAGADALDKFASKTGKLNIGLDLLRGLSEMSRAGAGSLDDLADAAGDVFNADTTQNAEQVLSVMRALAGQGKIGAVEMKDLAKQMAGLQAASAKFEGDAGKNMALMGGLAQMARAEGGAKSAPQAVNAVMSLTSQFSKGARIKGMAELGVEAKTKEGLNRPLDEVLFDLFGAAEKKSRAGRGKGGASRGLQDFDVILGKAIADANAKKVVDPLAKIYKLAGGGEAGMAAVREHVTKFTGATLTKEQMTTASKERMEETDAKFIALRGQFDKAVGERIIPKLLELVPVIEKLLPAFVDLNAKAIPAFVELLKSIARFVDGNRALIDNIAAHPIGTIMAAEVTKSMAAAGIGEVVKRLLGSQIPIPGGPAGGGATLPGVAGGKPGVIGAGLGLAVSAVTIAAAAAVTIQAGKIAIDTMFQDLNDKRNASAVAGGTGLEAALFLQRKVRAGTATPEDLKALAVERDKMKGQVEAQTAGLHKKSGAERLGRWLGAGWEGSPLSLTKLLGGTGNESSDYQKARDEELRQSTDTLKRMNEALNGATRALEKMGQQSGHLPHLLPDLPLLGQAPGPRTQPMSTRSGS